MDRLALLHNLHQQLNTVVSKKNSPQLCLWGEPGVGKSHVVTTAFSQLAYKNLVVAANQVDSGINNEINSDINAAFLPATAKKEISAKTLAELAPVALHINDLHLANENQTTSILGLCKELAMVRGVGLVISSREAMLGFKNSECPRLNPSELQSMLAALETQPLPSEASTWIQGRSLGNPLFAQEFLLYLKRLGHIWSDGRHWHWRTPAEQFLPPNIEALILQWCNPDNTTNLQNVLLAKTLLGKNLPEKIWASTAQLNQKEFLSIKRKLHQQGILRDNELSHPLLSDALQANSTEQQRQHIANIALNALHKENLEPRSELIEAAGIAQQDKLDTYLQLAALAKARNDPEKTGHWLALASQNNHGSKKTNLALEAATLLRHTQIVRATELAQLAAQTKPHTTTAIHLAAELYAQQGQLELAETMLGLLTDKERSTQQYWQVRLHLHHLAQVNHEALIKIWNSQPGFQANAAPELIVLVASAFGQQGKFDAAFALLKTLKTANLTSVEQCKMHETTGTLHYLMGHALKAATENSKALIIARQLQQPLYLSKLLRNEGVFAENINQAARALDCYRESMLLVEKHGSKLDHAKSQDILAPLLMDFGNFEESERLYIQALAVANDAENKLLRCNCRIGLALLYLDWNPPHAATMAVRHANVAAAEAQALENQQLQHAAISTLAMSEAQFGSPAQAMHWAEISMQENLLGGSPVRIARATYALGRAFEANGSTSKAIELVKKSENLHAENGYELTANRFGLEADRLEKNFGQATKRLAWFKEKGFLGAASIALRYFPELSTSTHVTMQAIARPIFNVLGPSTATINGITKPYKGSKRLELLAYLLQCRILGKTEATILELADALYENVNETNAKAILKQLVYLLRNQFGPQAIVSTVSGYALGAIESDAETFLHTGNTSLWRGPYLDSLFEDQQHEAREHLLEKLQTSVLDAKLPPAERLRLCEIWQQSEPYSHAAIQAGLQLLDQIGDTRQKERMLKASTLRLKEVGEILSDGVR